MSIPSELPPSQPQGAQNSDKEFNFRKLEERYDRLLNEERQKRIEAEQAVQAAQRRGAALEDEEDHDGDPYIDKKRLDKKLNTFGQRVKQETQSEIQRAVNEAIAKERQQAWVKANPDFYEVMQHAQKFAERDPEWAEEFLNLPEGFERQKLVYKSIKALGIHKKEEPKASIQDTINNNKKGLYYSPSGVGTAPYQSQGDFSPVGQKSAYDKMQELKNRLRLG